MPRKITINIVNDYCLSINYKLVSDKYINSHSKLELICNNNHHCTISFANLTNKNNPRRCIHCSKRDNKSIEYVIDFCKKVGWICLETEYKNCITKMLFACPNSHKIMRNFRDLEYNKGCAICLKLQKYTIENVIEYCTKIGFNCLSTEYKNAHTKLKLNCIKGHIFYCCFDKLKNNRGCPQCSSSKSEKIVKYIIETLIEETFIKCRPNFLKYSRRNLELDLYNEKLALAFEYQGAQHFTIVKSFKMTSNKLIEYQKRDNFKKKQCALKNIKLICIPPFDVNNANYQKIKNTLVDILEENNVKYSNKIITNQEIILAKNT